MVELTREDWTRLTNLIHGYGSVGALERALGHGERQASGAPNPVDLADMVRVEVAHQLGGSRPRRDPQREPGLERPRLLPTWPPSQHRHLLWPASGVAWISLALILVGGVSPLRAAGAGLLGVFGFHVGLRRDGRVAWWLWRAIATACVVAWAVAASWPIEASALVLGSVLAGCIGPLRSKFVQSGWS